MTEGLLSGLSEEELRRYRGVLRVRYGTMTVDAFEPRGRQVARYVDVPPHVRHIIFQEQCHEIRAMLCIGDHRWAEVIRGLPAPNIPLYTFKIPLP